MIPGVVLLFYRSPLSMVTLDNILDKKNIRLIYIEFIFYHLRSELKYQKYFCKGSNKILLFL